MTVREKKEINIQIGEQVRIVRERAGLTQEQLAEQIEVSPQYVSDLERGVVGISLTTLKRLCRATGAASDQILFGTKVRERTAELGNLCSELTDEQFALLTDMIKSFVKVTRI